MIRDASVFLEHADWFVGRKLEDCFYPPEIVAEMKKEPVVEVLPAQEIVTEWSWSS